MRTAGEGAPPPVRLPSMFFNAKVAIQDARPDRQAGLLRFRRRAADRFASFVLRLGGVVP